ncbi:hypothetical protein [Dehalogenimonas etheniformans]|uniref:Helix-turn-helix type 11 domain-containing protein n=1 Tax=Dehalogenimonas etheniformans TaxID=1536648 RepID=A0A2P5P8P9_9CHLR|nr:hypothetical protein [Dehalogenimonas etheniformans]PPD58674.1 hypothetical protein JP09_002015 [Dehalogenimonas etheniformans]QNT76555.1 hypothetical protein HX448_07605 [Dehalogenimonas etheniformans]
MTTKEIKFRKWLIGVLKERGGTIPLEDAKNAGAAYCDCSQMTIERYVKKFAHSGEIFFRVAGEYMNGKWIQEIVLGKPKIE